MTVYTKSLACATRLRVACATTGLLFVFFGLAALFGTPALPAFAVTPAAAAPPTAASILSAPAIHHRLAGATKAGTKSPPASAQIPPRKTPIQDKSRYRIRSKWSKARIIKEQARCTQFLRGLDLVAIPLAPIRHNACGAAAPIKLFSIGSNPKVALSPAPIVTCELAAAMYRWLKNDIQPMARKHLGAPIRRINIMSSYSCRNAYGRKHGKLSQHAHANALDIRGFETTTGVKTALLADWRRTRRRHRKPVLRASQPRQSRQSRQPGQQGQQGQPGESRRLRTATQRRSSRRQRRKEAAIIAAARKAARKFAAMAKASSHATITASHPDYSARRAAAVSLALHGAAGRPAGRRHSQNNENNETALSSIFANINYLGATRKTAAQRAAGHSGRINRSAFLHAIHKRACRIFGTVLGPDANYAHRHHFHVDMQKRRLGPFCR